MEPLALMMLQTDYFWVLKFLFFFSLSLFSGLSQVDCHVSEDLTQVINKNIAMLEGRFGILLFLYSILLTKVNY